MQINSVNNYKFNSLNCENGTKKSKINHGYGLSQVQSILAQLHAEYAFDYQDGWFTFVAEIPL